jgi:colicin import membrane protein
LNAVVELEKPATEIAEYSPTAAALAQLRARLANVAYDVSTTKGMTVAKKDLAEVRGLWVALEAKRVEIKAPALERARMIDAEAKRIDAELRALGKPISEQIKAEEERKEAEKAAREQAERETAARLQSEIDTIRNYAVEAVGQPSAVIQTMIDGLAPVSITIDLFGDRAGEAAQVKAQTLAKLDEMRLVAVAHEAEQARMAAEREEMARLRAEQEAQAKAERERIADEQKAEAGRLAAERKAFEKEQAAARAEAKKREDADRARRDEEDRLAREARAAEDKRIADARAALEAEQRAAREAEEATAAARRKAEQDYADTVAAEKREAAAAEQRRLDEEAAAKRAADEAKHAADLKVRDAAQPLLAALRDALEAVKTFHGPDAWDTYWNHSPEMTRCRAAIELATGEKA